MNPTVLNDIDSVVTDPMTPHSVERVLLTARRESEEEPLMGSTAGDERLRTTALLSPAPSSSSSPSSMMSLASVNSFSPFSRRLRRSSLSLRLKASLLSIALLFLWLWSSSEFVLDQLDSLWKTISGFLFSLGLYHQPPVSYPSDDSLLSIHPAVSSFNSSLCLLHFSGRWGNHVFRLMMSVTLAMENRLKLYLPQCSAAWMLPNIAAFVAPCPWYTTDRVDWTGEFEGGNIRGRSPRLDGMRTKFHVVVDGWFQEHTSLFAPYRRQLQAMLTPDERLHAALRTIHTAMMEHHCGERLIVTVHVRHGDFQEVSKGQLSSGAVRIPIQWYVDWLHRIQLKEMPLLQRLKKLQDLTCPTSTSNGTQWSGQLILLVISDDVEAVATEFRRANYEVFTVADVMSSHFLFSPFASLSPDVTQYYLDWWLLSQARVLATSHSTFSLTAAMFSPHASGDAHFVRPDHRSMSIAPFDPWAFKYEYTAFYQKLSERSG